MAWYILWLIGLLGASVIVSGIVVYVMERKPPLDPYDVYDNRYMESEDNED